jgi:methanogenic corrinoid protein MtbC1
MSAREIYLDVLGPALVEVGARWQRGIATIAQEHLATAVVGSIMTRLAGQLATTPPVRRRIVLACTDGELHDTGLRMVRDFLEGDGWEVFYLGAETPADSLQFLVDRAQPHVVGLSTALPHRVPVARVTVAALRSRPARPYILLGGHAYGGDAGLARHIGADGFAANAGEASLLLRCEFGDGAGSPVAEDAAFDA